MSIELRRKTALSVAVLLLCSVGCWGDLKSDLIEKVPMYKTATGAFAPVYKALAQQMVQDYGITDGICVDVGCGSGAFALEYAKTTQCTVYALDIDPASVRLTSILVDEAGLTGRVIPVEGDAQDMSLRSEFADLVFSRGSIPFWPDREAGVRECYRILKPGGVAYVGGGFSRILDPKIRNPIARERGASFADNPPEGFRVPNDLDEVARGAGIPQDQFRTYTEPIAGWWLEIRKPADHAAWYRRWSTSLGPYHQQMAQQLVDKYDLKRGRALEVGWGAGSLSLPLARMTKLDLYVAGYDADAAKVANERAGAAGLADRVQAVDCNPHHLMFDDNTFDYVFGHAGPAVWADPPKVIREIARVLRPRGVALVGSGVPITCDTDAEMVFCKLARNLRDAPDAPVDAFKQCADGATFTRWVAQSGVRATLILSDEVHSQWIEIRKSER